MDKPVKVIKKGKELSIMKRITWIIIIAVIILILVCALNMRFIIYYSKQVLSQNIKEFPTSWHQTGNIQSFESTYHEEDLRLVRLELGTSSGHVRNLYGAPLRTKVITVASPNNADYTVYCTYWTYPDFELGFQNSAEKTRPRPQDIGHLFMITVKTDKFQSYRGIKVGDPMGLVKKRYSVPSQTIYDDLGSIFYEWQLSYIKFGQIKGKVSEIELGENAD